MRSWKLSAVAFALLALATLGAFFLIQALKTADPLVWGNPGPKPAAFNPVSGRTASCISKSGELLNYRQTELTLAASQADTVGVYVVSESNAGGGTVATISSGTPMRKSILGSTKQWYPVSFTWDGRLDNGRLATGGTYYFRIVLQKQGRSINLSDNPMQIITQPPHPRILSVRLIGGGEPGAGTTTTGTGTTGSSGTTAAGSTTTGSGAAASGGAPPTGAPVLSPPDGGVRITFTPGSYRRVWIDIYRTDVAGRPQLVTQQRVGNLNRNWTTWNGKINGRPAPAGTYLVGITAQDQACNQASWPVVLPPAPGTTPRAGVSIRYLTVAPPLTPSVSGSRASVAIDSPGTSFSWRLRRAGTSKVLEHGSGAAGSSTIHVPMPRRRAGLYTLVVRSGTQSAAVPLVASRAGAAATRARVLVVLPMLDWIGASPTDDSGDGLPDTLGHHESVSLDRPLVDGPPISLGADAALLAYLDSQHLSYQLTTDVALAEGRGPSLVDRWGVLFPDGEHFLPAQLASGSYGLAGFVRAGGRVLALGTGTFEGVSRLSGFPTDPRAGAPTLTSTDPFGAQRGPVTPTSGELITELTDQLGLFGGVPAFSGFSQYQPIEPPHGGAGAQISAAGVANGTPAIVAFQLGSGIVMEVGLPDFGGSLAHDVDSQELISSAWPLLARQR